MGSASERATSALAGVELPERYEPIRLIARGGMASVWCAHDRTLDREVAVKLLAEPFAHDELAVRRFKREGRTAARLSGHRNVVTIYDVGQAEPSRESPGGRPFIVMEYLTGGTVAEALRARAVDRVTAVRWLREAAGALDYAHERGVIHRDVKLANFLLDGDRVLHVADFGIAQLGTEDTLTASGEVLGTAGYLAPERALGQPATAASDRYALAVAAFELLVGERPFVAEHFAAQARQHVDEPPPRASARNPKLPPALDDVLIRGMAKRPEDRFASASELIDVIEAALWGRPLRAPAQVGPAPATQVAAATLPDGGRPEAAEAQRSSAPPPTPYRSTSRGRIVALAALALALIGVGIAAAAGSGGSPAPTAAAGSPQAQPPARHASTRHTAPRARAGARTSASPATGTAPAAPAAAPPAAHGADALQAEGHQLMVAGNYSAAIPLLRQAVDTAPKDSLTYAYALYDLGRSLRLAGDPRAAVPILWRRLQIPNQTGVVRAELALALQALGRQASAGAPVPAGPPPKPPAAKHHGHGGPGAGSGEGG